MNERGAEFHFRRDGLRPGSERLPERAPDPAREPTEVRRRRGRIRRSIEDLEADIRLRRLLDDGDW